MLKHAQNELENRFLATFEQAAVGIAHVAPNGSWVRVNARLCQIVGYNHDELMAMTFQDITHPDDLALDLNYVQSMLARKISHYSMEKRYIRKNGTVVWINLTVSLVWTEQQQPDYFISVVEDISLRKNVEFEVKRLRNSLVDVQESERRFIALELHDEFGQRLSAANIVLSLAQKINTAPEVHAHLLEVKSALDGLIATTKAMAQHLHPAQLEHFGLSSAIRALAGEIQKAGSIRLTVEDTLNEQRFHQTLELTAYRVVQEAVSNALRHSKSDTINVHLARNEQMLTVQVRDSGIGLDPQRKNQGLGLLGMQERVESVGGIFTAESNPGKGTLIAATLPAKEQK